MQLIEEVTRNKKLQRFKAIMAAWQRVLPEMFPSMKVRCIHAAFALPQSLVMRLEQFWKPHGGDMSKRGDRCAESVFLLLFLFLLSLCSSSSAPCFESSPSSVVLTG